MIYFEPCTLNVFLAVLFLEISLCFLHCKMRITKKEKLVGCQSKGFEKLLGKVTGNTI